MRETSRSEDAAASAGGPAYRVLRRVMDVRPEEVPVLFWCWLYIFAVLSSYYIMRPIRDEMGVAGGVNNLQWLFTGTLVGMLVLNVPFGWLVKTLPRRRFVPLTYRFFALNIVLFAAVLYFANPEQTVWVGRIFFIWASVYNLFVVSIFWQMNVDLFSPEQGKRLFGFIAAGATIGAIAGSAATATLARYVPPMVLLLGAAVLLEIAVFAVGRLSRLSPALSRRPSGNDERPIGGSVIAGFTHAFRSPYLINVSLFILLFAISSTILYFQQAGIVSHSFADRGAQREFFATVDLCVNILTLVVQLFFTGRIVMFLGVALALAFLPMLTMAGFGVLVFAPTLSAIAVFQVLRRAGDYAIARPTREMLFTVVPREDRYKAKSFIDTCVYRFGDQVGAWGVAGLRALGAGASELAWAAIPIALLWLINALWLGRRQEARAQAAAQAAAAE
ncbi:MAG TPA: MFS transporter [Stellaceae bacterium]|nr:MFS transporter [Stellaceae bacterium]